MDDLNNELSAIKERLTKIEVSRIADVTTINQIIADYQSRLNGLLETSQLQLAPIEARAKEQLRKIIEVADELDNARSGADDANDILVKVNAIFKTINSRKNDIDEIYYELNGQEKENELGDKVHVDGLADLLESAYNKLSDKVGKLEDLIQVKRNDITEILNQLTLAAAERFNNFIEISNSEKNGIVLKLRELLPNAMTAGLSSAYNKKRRLEEKESGRQKVVFLRAIIAMTVFAFFPIAINVYYFYGENVNADVLIKNFPYLLSIILPLYIPVLWIANSANKNTSVPTFAIRLNVTP